MEKMLRVLIVEDEDIIRKGLVHTIDWMSMDCTIVGEACNGVEGLKLIKELKPDLVITDIRMPVKDGIHMLEEALNVHRFHSIILTGYSEFEYAKQAVSLKVYEYLLKPVDEEKLANLVEKIKKDISQRKVFDNVVARTKTEEETNLIDLDIYVFPGSDTNYYVGEVLKQVKQHYNRKISLDLIASDLGVSLSFLSRKFKETTSMTFLDMLNKYRVQKSIELLNTGKYRVYEVSDMIGFNEYKHFCNVFKRYTNVSPTEFIKANGYIIHKNP